MHVIYIAHITYIIHMIKLFFKAYKKPIKHVAVNFFLYMKMLTGHYQKTKNGLKKKARERYINLAEEEKKNKKRQCSRERYKNLSEQERNKKHQHGCEL